MKKKKSLYGLAINLVQLIVLNELHHFLKSKTDLKVLSTYWDDFQ